MPGEIIGEGLAGIIKLLWRIAAEIIFELLITGAGRLIIRVVRPHSEPNELSCVVVGLAFWVAVGLALYGLARATAA